jgi:hypothetical protein
MPERAVEKALGKAAAILLERPVVRILAKTPAKTAARMVAITAI